MHPKTMGKKASIGSSPNTYITPHTQDTRRRRQKKERSMYGPCETRVAQLGIPPSSRLSLPHSKHDKRRTHLAEDVGGGVIESLGALSPHDDPLPRKEVERLDHGDHARVDARVHEHGRPLLDRRLLEKRVHRGGGRREREAEGGDWISPDQTTIWVCPVCAVCGVCVIVCAVSVLCLSVYACALCAYRES